jgi:MFS family permease
MNFTIFEISVVTFLLAIAGAVAQYPIGKLSDKFDPKPTIKKGFI